MNQNNDPFSLGNQLPGDTFRIINEERLRELIAKINDKSLPLEVRDDAKNYLMLAYSRMIYGEIFRLTGGKIGVEDRQTANFNSAFGFLKEKMSEMAEKTEAGGFSLKAAIVTRLRGWAFDKFDRVQAQKRGGKATHVPANDAENLDDGQNWPDEELMKEETLAKIKADVFEAVSKLEGLEQKVVISRFTVDGIDMLSIRDTAELLGEGLVDVDNAWRRARDKLRKWLDDPRRDDESSATITFPLERQLEFPESGAGEG